MLYAFGFERIGVVVADIYFVNPDPDEGQEGPEQGVRVELRLFERPERPGSIYAAQPLAVDRALWRADLLESVDRPGTLDRAHHHPYFRGWEPSDRHYVEALTADPLGWVGARLSALEDLLAEAGVPIEDRRSLSADAPALAAAVPEIVAAAARLLDRVCSSHFGGGPTPVATEPGIRIGWL
ncbi:MAG: hypothetical protein ABIW46_04210 [Acidimicrobiales bacterium]